MFDKTGEEWTRAAINKVAQEQDYYPPETEEQLSRIVERPGHQALKVVRQGGTLTVSQRDRLADYIAVLAMRGPRKRRISSEIARETVPETLVRYRRELRELQREENPTWAREAFKAIDRVEAEYQHTMPPEVQEQIESPWPSLTVVAAIRAMTWRVVEVMPPQSLFTTDTPVFFFESLGLGNEHSEFTVPIDSYRAIMGSYQGAAGATLYQHALPDVVVEINRRMSSSAERFVFSSRPNKRIEALLAAGSPLRRIQW